MTEAHRAAWLTRIETLGTTVVVLMIGAMALWSKSAVQGPRMLLVIGSALLIYPAGLVGLGRRSDSAGVPWWPFAAAGFAAGGVAEVINAQLLLTRASVAAAVTGVVIGTAHWVALRTWLRLTAHRAER